MQRRRLLVTGGASFAAILTGCLADTDTDDESPALVDDTDDETNSEDDTDDTTPADDTEGDEESEDEPDDVEATIGSLVEGENIHLVVEDLDRTTEIGEFQEADEDNEFLLTQVAMLNVSDEFQHVSQLLQASVRDDEDYSYNMAIGVTDEPTFDGGQIAPGELERGMMVFEVPDDASGLSLQFDFDVSIFGGVDRATIDLEDDTDIHTLEQDLRIDTYDLGDAVEYEGVTVEIRDVETETELGTFTEAEEGDEFVIVDLEITNDSGEEQRISSMLQMMLKDGEGWSYQEDFGAAAELDRAFDETGALVDGETRAGQVAYEIEEGIEPLYWVFEFTLWTDGDKTFWQVR